MYDYNVNCIISYFYEESEFIGEGKCPRDTLIQEVAQGKCINF